MRQRREIIILGLLLAALVLFTLATLEDGDDEGVGRPSTHSSRPEGALALLRWLGELGYDARRLEFTEFAIPAEADALFILSPSTPLNRTSTEEVLAWVEAGGVLVVTQEQPGLLGGESALLSALRIENRFYEGEGQVLERVPVLQPALSDPPVAELEARTDQILVTERTDTVPLAGFEDAVVLLGLQQGAGYIYVASTSRPFSNEGLKAAGSPGLVLNILRRVPLGGTIIFDEYHHGYFAPPSLRSLLLESVWGRAVIFALAFVGLYLVLTGRRFGRPVPLTEESAPRSSAEYIESLADLFQRGGKRAHIARHYRLGLKRRLARPFGLNPFLDDAAFVAELARYREGLDAAALSALLARLSREPASDDELLRLIAAADAIPTR